MCFTLGWAEQLIIWLIIVFAVIAIIKILLPQLTALIPFPVVGAIIQIILWAVVAIMVVKVIFMLFACLLGGPGMHTLL